MKFCYVILHYNVFEDTCACVDSILRVKDRDSEIVIIDNNSPNDSGRDLVRKYSSRNDIHIVMSNKNEGFARGNNRGYEYAREELNAEVIVDMNNDIEILTKEFEEIVINYIHDNKSVGLIAPRIRNINGYDQNPYRLQPQSPKNKIRSSCMYYLYYISLSIPQLNSLVYTIYRKRFGNGHSKIDSISVNKYGIVPHGSFLIFTPSFTSLFRIPFVEDTFFYGEEDILFDMLGKYGLETLYCSDVEVLHKEKKATSTISENQMKKERFIAINKAKSNMSFILHHYLGYKNSIH